MAAGGGHEVSESAFGLETRVEGLVVLRTQRLRFLGNFLAGLDFHVLAD